MAARLPTGRIGTPADIAKAYLYLMDSTFTTGTTLHIDGGHALV
jgi:NAD(P)-dependent dehydrogenase (short-subunit alcohol dehydrogenase family)